MCAAQSWTSLFFISVFFFLKMATPGKKRQHPNLDSKIQAIKDIEEGKLNKTEIAKKYGVASSTLNAWIKNKDKILESETSFSPKSKRLRTGLYPEPKCCPELQATQQISLLSRSVSQAISRLVSSFLFNCYKCGL